MSNGTLPGRITVHPRACGEQRGKDRKEPNGAGSSPRLREQFLHRTQNLPESRFIPAPAGNSPAGDRAGAAGSVHPRACGEQAQHLFKHDGNAGSSPRLRGTEPVRRRRPCCRRFIPAPAGNSSPPARLPPAWAVHPRACGEQILTGPVGITVAGSSPRLRGTAHCASR